MGDSYLVLDDLDCGDDAAKLLFHIVYSPPFSCPVLYVRGSFADGRMLREEAIQRLWGSVPAVVTQGEHPVTGAPFFFAHPCETMALMRTLPEVGVHNWIDAWFSWISPKVGVVFPAVDHTRAGPVEVSLIVPCFNGAKFAEELVLSIAAQTAKCRMQAVFCDDGSSDGTLDAITSLARLHLPPPRFVVTILKNAANSGAGYSRNRCVEAALGMFLCFLDCDDVMHAQRVELQLAAAAQETNHDAIVSCQMECFPTKSPFYAFVNSLVLSSDLMAFRFREVTTPLPTWFMHRSVWEKTGSFLELRDHPEDMDFFLRHTQRGGLLFKLAEELLRYRIHDSQATHRMHRNLLLEYKARLFSQSVEGWPKWKTFQIWGCGRDAKKFFKFLSPAVRSRVSHFLEIDANKHGLLYQDIPIVDISEVRPPFVCCVTIGKNNGIEQKLAPFLNGTDYFQLT